MVKLAVIVSVYKANSSLLPLASSSKKVSSSSSISEVQFGWLKRAVKDSDGLPPKEKNLPNISATYLSNTPIIYP